MKKLLALTAAGALAAALAVPAFAATKTLKVDDNFYGRSGSPTVVIHKGDSVKWVWHAKHQHNAFQVGGPGHFHTPTHSKSGTFTHKFTTRGTYKFICSHVAGMALTIKVK